MNNMKWKSSYNHPDGWAFTIEREPMFEQVQNKEIFGFYLRVADGEGNDIFDYLQDALAIAQYQAFRKWGVPEDSWVEQKE